MSIMTRFKDIMSANINALLDKAENPEKMADQYVRNMNNDLSKVKSETAAVMAEEQRAKRELRECRADIEKMESYAVKALQAGNEGDARTFLERKTSLGARLSELQTANQMAETNAAQMRKMHDKLVSDIGELEARKNAIKAKWAVAKTQEKMNKLGASVAGTNQSMSAFGRMEDNVNKALDQAHAMAELNSAPQDDMDDLTAKYNTAGSSQVDDELAALKAKILLDK
ncbi:PspA/IM30 family protein [Bacillus sp. SKDU12]|uniref:PspA/IM30 family protein n=1 Tax=Bacillus sp. SKDU12 TaxID=1337053 RepID=UPI0013897585|nr:phage shock protein A [Bacillus sp. SKDU12]